MRETLPQGCHHVYDRLVGPRVARFYRHLAKGRPGARTIVDLGCGPGHFAAILEEADPGSRVLGVDADPVQIRLAARRMRHGVVGRVEALPLADRSVDWAVTTESFHHWGDPAAGIEEAHRVLRKGGELWIVEGTADVGFRESRRWLPALMVVVARLVFLRHGYSRRRLDRVVRPLLQASPFGHWHIERREGWWVIRLRRT